MQNVRALELVHPMNHPNVQRQHSEDLTPERQLSNQTRERTFERADEPPTQRPRLENPANSIRWSRVCDPRKWFPATAVEDEENMWTETDSEVLWQHHIWENNEKPACLCQEEWDELFSNTCENVTARVCFSRSEFTGLTATRMTRGDELPRRMIPESEWPRFLQATVAEWAAILDTSAVPIISPAAAKDIRKHLSHRTVPSRRVYREKPGEGVGAASKAKCRWCVLGHRDPDIRQLNTTNIPDGTWVEAWSLVQLNAAVYGLVNAPSAWRKTIVRGIENLRYRRSCYDPVFSV